MKFFWALIGVLVLATVALLASGTLGGGDGKKQQLADATPTQAAIASEIAREQQQSKSDEKPALSPPLPVADAAPAVDAPYQPAAKSEATGGDPVPQPAPTATQDASPPVSAAPDTVLTPTDVKPTAPATTTSDKQADQPPQPDKGAQDPPAKPEAAKPTEDSGENALVKLRKEIEAQRAAEAAAKSSAPPATPSAPRAAAAPTEDAGSGVKFGQAKAEQKPDGSLLVDGKYVVKGKGTKEEPYKVTWDHLVSAQNEYAPKDGRKTIPARIQALNDTWVELTGYVAFPLMSSESDELLSMMNQWDGCCIGIPPTPYDAIEVRLVAAVSGNARLTTYGTVKGKFKVDPHLVGGWLVGLYVMDDTTLTPVSYGGIAP
jgi:hypothetical protein